MKKRIILSALALVFGLSLIITPSATRAQAVQSARCTMAKDRLEQRVTRVETAITSRTEQYTALRSRVETLLTSATSAGYDVTALTAARDAVQADIATFTEKATAYTAALTAANGLACGDNDGAFVEGMVMARTALRELRAAMSDVATSLRSEAIPAIKDYAAWLRGQATDNTEGQE